MRSPDAPRLAWVPQALAYVLAGFGLTVAGALLHTLLPVALGGMLLLGVALEALLVAHRAPTATLAVSPTRLPEGQEADATVTLHGSPGDQQVRVRLDPTLELVAGTNLFGELKGRDPSTSFRVRAPVRGPRAIGPVEVRSWSPSRLWTRELALGQAQALEVIPRRADIKRFAILSKSVKPREGRFSVNRPGQGFDFFTLRGYSAGDTMRNVNWKASARHEDLIVNQRQRETLTDLTLLLDARLLSGVGPRGDTPLDRACRVALGLFEQGIRSRDQVRLVAYGSKVEKLAHGPDRIVACEALLAGLEAGGTVGLRAAWSDVRGDIRSPGPVIVLSSLEGEPDAAEAVADMMGRHHPVTVFSPTPSGPTWDAPASARRRQAREETLRRLSSLGATVVDWKPGTAVEAHAPGIAGALQ
ncbi:MAG TPA: DUF58 domain-containing protein [Candidatus Thermoplasmatota archaeon]|nr:DUF58 domain-containing protein [Candidatus Thermoplasmatota archaeon]